MEAENRCRLAHEQSAITTDRTAGRGGVGAMKMLTIKNATIESVSLGNSDSIGRGMLSSWVFLSYGKSVQQGFGGYRLDSSGSDGCAHKWILGVLKVAGVESWDKLVGRCVRAKVDGLGGIIVAIGHITEDIWFTPAEDLQ